MKFAENGTRIDDLKNILARIAEVACLFDTSGISIRAINRCRTGHRRLQWCHTHVAITRNLLYSPILS